MAQEKLFLIVINIQKNQTICFQIIGMPSLSFSIIYALGGWWGGALLAARADTSRNMMVLQLRSTKEVKG